MSSNVWLNLFACLTCCRMSSALLSLQGSYHSASSVDVVSSLRVYVYDMPSIFTSDVTSSPPGEGVHCGHSHVYGEEYVIHQQLLNSSARTHDPEEADIFYVPMYLYDNCQPWDPLIAQCRPHENLSCAHPIGGPQGVDIPGLALHHVMRNYPYFNRSNGANHVMTIAFDVGRCILSRQDRETFVNVRFLLESGEYGENRGCFRPDYDVAIPLMLDDRFLQRDVNANDRSSGPLLFFVGLHYGPLYDQFSLQRQDFFSQFLCYDVPTCDQTACMGEGQCPVPGIVAWNTFFNHIPQEDYQQLELRSRFCLHLEGTVLVSSRIYESMLTGCVPVVYANAHYDVFEFPSIEGANYSDFIVSIPEQRMNETVQLLQAISDDEYLRRQNAMLGWTEGLLYREPAIAGGALQRIFEKLRSNLGKRRFASSAYDVQTGRPL